MSRSLHRYLLVIGMIISVFFLIIGSGPIRITATTTVKSQIVQNGPDSDQANQFNVLLVNTSASNQANLSFKIFFSLNAGQVASDYVLDKNYDSSGVATVSGPTLYNGSIYYYQVSYGSTALPYCSTWPTPCAPPLNQWEFDASLHLNLYQTTFGAAGDWYHAEYNVGELPLDYTDTNNITVYQNGTLIWGAEPEILPTPTNTSVVPTNTP